MRKEYPSDISRDLPESASKKTRPRTADLYDVFCAILYLLESGCQWRMLPSDFPKWRTVHHYFSKWSMKPENDLSLLEQALKACGDNCKHLSGK